MLPAAASVIDLLQQQPARLGGVHVRAPADAARAAWLDALRAALPAGIPWVRIPANVTQDALLGGLDLPATLATGRPVARPGLLARAHGGVLVLPMAERAAPLTLACLQQAMDDHCVQLARDGLVSHYPASFDLILLEEEDGWEDPGQPGTVSAVGSGIRDRLAFTLDGTQLREWWQAGAGALAGQRAILDALAEACNALDAADDDDAPDAGTALGSVATSATQAPSTAPLDGLAVLCLSAWQLGISSLRAPVQAWAVAQALALQAGRVQPVAEDLQVAASLVYAARATRVPTEAPAAEAAQQPQPSAASPDQTPDPAQEDAPAVQTQASGSTTPPEPPPSAEAGDPDPQAAAAQPQPPSPPPGSDPGAMPPAQPPASVDSSDAALALSAVVANQLPKNLLARLQLSAPGVGSGRVNASPARRTAPVRHGRPVGSQPGDPRQGRSLDLLATLRAALPWQKLRSAPAVGGARLAVRASDFRVRTLKPRTRSTAVFAVDASGSAAMQRLGEAKGAIESLLAQCYVRRDQVALVSFRGSSAEVLLPPTRSLSRVRRELSALPGGGGTPLANGIALAAQVANEVRRRGDAPLLVLLTDGRANVSMAGIGGRAQADQDALAAAQAVRQQRLPCLLIDIARQVQPRADALARALGAEYLLLPGGKSGALSAVVQARMGSGKGVVRA